MKLTSIIIFVLSLFLCSCDNSKTSQATSPPALVEEKIYKLDDFQIASTYLSNPSEAKTKLVGKTIETKIFPDQYISEGSKFRLIGDGSGVTCLMDAQEYSKHNSRTTKVVRGKMAVWSGGIGLDNCIYISEGEGWVASDTISGIN